MKGIFIVGLILLAFGLITLVLEGFPVKAERDTLDIGPLEATVEHTEEMHVPRAAAIGSIVAGVVCVALGASRKRTTP
jgi:hypothetical protein